MLNKIHLQEISITPRKSRGFTHPQWTWITYDMGETWQKVYDMNGEPILWCNENIQSIKKLCNLQSEYTYWGISGCNQKKIGNSEIDNF
jgi:hypothetical protein